MQHEHLHVCQAKQVVLKQDLVSKNLLMSLLDLTSASEKTPALWIASEVEIEG